MREIKFRVWDKEDKKLILNPRISFVNGNDWVLNRAEPGTVIDYQPSSKFILMQYTGLKDNTKWEDLTEEERENWIQIKKKTPDEWNGKEIYEGDILETSRNSLNDTIVKVEQSRSGEYIIVGNGLYYGLLKWIDLCEKVKIIGNIHENPELLSCE